MNTPLWVTELADVFWKAVGRAEPFPRRLVDAIVSSPFDLVLKERDGLRVSRVNETLSRLGLQTLSETADRPLRGCLVARAGAGLIFLDTRDRPDERSVTLAHELAHFLRDYWQPRERAVVALGEAIREVLDGQRPPTLGERFHSVLRSLSLGVHTHLMHRDGFVLLPEIEEAELGADRLALELLAPSAAVLDSAAGPLNLRSCQERLRQVFGLPSAVATMYAEILLPGEDRPEGRELFSGKLCRTSPSREER